jgi:PAS domain S-box-containing protein
MSTSVEKMSDTDRLLSSVGVGMWSWDAQNSQLSLDQVVRNFFEIPDGEEFSLIRMQKNMSALDAERYNEALQECEATGNFACEFCLQLDDGQLRYLSGRGHTVAQDGGGGVIQGVFIDVTAAKQLEETLKSTQATMQALVDGIPGLFSYIDNHYRIWFMSSKYRDIFSKDLNDLIGVHIKELIGEEAFIERKPRYDAALAGEVVNSESERKMPDGKRACFAVTHQPYIENGQVKGVITLGIDITERRVAEAALEAQSEELQRSNRDLEQFAYVASHDLKAPLRAIEVIIEWLLEDLGDYKEGDVQENLSLLSQRTTRLTRLLDDLLDFSRAGRKVGDINTFDLKDFIEDIAVLVGPPEGMQVGPVGAMPSLTTHHAAFETVLRNLINNAIKHHPEPASGHIEVSCQDKGDLLQISVMDDGVGIPAEYADKVFKMFQTLKPRDDTEGSGMGLAIVQRIIDWQGGEIWFEDNPAGKGVIFHFTWNKQPVDTPEVEAEQSLAEVTAAPDEKFDYDAVDEQGDGHEVNVNDKEVNDELTRI